MASRPLIAVLTALAVAGALSMCSRPVSVTSFTADATIVTAAGGLPQAGPPTSTGQVPSDVIFDGSTLLVSDGANDVIWAVDTKTSRERVMAGNGTAGHGGDGGPATGAELNYPTGMALDGAGDLFIADGGNNRVREVHRATGVISTVAGDGYPGYSGDGASALRAHLYHPDAIAVSDGRLYIADTYNNRVRAVDLSTGVIVTVAGNGAHADSGDGAPAVDAALAFPQGVAADGNGDIYISDTDNSIVRELNSATGTITTIAGDKLAGMAGDGGPATEARLDFPTQLSLAPGGTLLVADSTNNAVRRVDLATGIITTVAGDGDPGFAGDGGPATQSKLSNPTGVTESPGGAVYIADSYNNRVRSVSPTGTVATFAGNGTAALSPDALRRLSIPSSVATDLQGDIFVSDTGNNEVKEITTSGSVRHIAGDGIGGYNGNGIAATGAELSNPVGLAVGPNRDLYIADSGNDMVRKVDLATGIITTVAGTGQPGYNGDGIGATQAMLFDPTGVAVDRAGNVYIADSGNDRVREVVLHGPVRNLGQGESVLVTLAGTGEPGFSGDRGPAANAGLFDPTGVALDSHGNLYIADRYDNRIRRVDASTHLITTVAGDGRPGFSGDGGPAKLSGLGFPYSVTVDTGGDLFVADSDDQRVREVAVAGDITTVAGDGILGFSGHCRVAVACELSNPTGVAVGAGGRLYIADGGNGRIRVVKEAGTAVRPRPAAVGYRSPASGGSSSGVALGQEHSATAEGFSTKLPFNPQGVVAPIDGAGPIVHESTIAPGLGEALSTRAAFPGTLGPDAPSVDIFGDSLAYTLAEGLVPAGAEFATDIVNSSVIGCGITQGGPIEATGAVGPQPPMCDNWDQIWSGHIAQDHPAVAAILIGRWEILDRVHRGVWTHIGQGAFDSYLESELRLAVETASGADAAGESGSVAPTARVVFLTMPYLQPYASPTGSGVYPETDPLRVDTFNALEYLVARQFPGTAYVFDLGSMLEPGGHFALFDDNQTVRWPDGTHITTAGAALVAPVLMESLARLATPGG